MKEGLQKSFDKMSSSDSESSDIIHAIIHEDSSESEIDETADTFKGSTSFCAKCLTVFKDKEKETAIGCDTPYCRQWFHQGCIDIDISGMSEKEKRPSSSVNIVKHRIICVCSIKFDIIC